MKRYGIVFMVFLSAVFIGVPYLIHDKNFLKVGACVVVVNILFFTPIITIDDHSISFLFLNPFKKRIKFDFSEITKVEFYVSKFSHTTIYTAGTKKVIQTADNYAVKRVYKRLIALGVNVESKGDGAFYWKP